MSGREEAGVGGKEGALTAHIVGTLRDEFCQVLCVEGAGAVALQICKSAGLRFLGHEVLLPLAHSCEEFSEGQFSDVLAWKQLLEEALRLFLVFSADSGMPAVDEVELDGDLVADAHGEAGLVEDLREGLAWVQNPAGVRSVVHVEDCPDVVGEDDVDVKATCHAYWLVSKATLEF